MRKSEKVESKVVSQSAELTLMTTNFEVTRCNVNLLAVGRLPLSAPRSDCWDYNNDSRLPPLCSLTLDAAPGPYRTQSLYNNIISLYSNFVLIIIRAA